MKKPLAAISLSRRFWAATLLLPAVVACAVQVDLKPQPDRTPQFSAPGFAEALKLRQLRIQLTHQESLPETHVALLDATPAQAALQPAPASPVTHSLAALNEAPQLLPLSPQNVVLLEEAIPAMAKPVLPPNCLPDATPSLLCPALQSTTMLNPAEEPLPELLLPMAQALGEVLARQEPAPIPSSIPLPLRKPVMLARAAKPKPVAVKTVPKKVAKPKPIRVQQECLPWWDNCFQTTYTPLK
jgi:hypothetical protein